MAIIRKGDKAAEAGLRARAKKQAVSRMSASNEKLRKAGLESVAGKSVTNKTGTPKATKVNPSAKNPIVRSNSPVSGSAVMQTKLALNKDTAGLKRMRGEDV